MPVTTLTEDITATVLTSPDEAARQAVARATAAMKDIESVEVKRVEVLLENSSVVGYRVSLEVSRSADLEEAGEREEPAGGPNEPPHTRRNPNWSWSVGVSYWRILVKKTSTGLRGTSPSPRRSGEAAARTLASTTTGISSRIEGNSPRGHWASICGSGSQRHPPRPRARGTSTPASPEPQGSSAVPHLARRSSDLSSPR